jgi:hypothetical protein
MSNPCDYGLCNPSQCNDKDCSDESNKELPPSKGVGMGMVLDGSNDITTRIPSVIISPSLGG